MMRAILTLLLLLLTTAVRAGEADAAAAVERLAEAGAAQLALALIDARQGQPGAQDWVAWERLRLELLARQERWDALVERTDALPAGVPEEFARWAGSRRVHAQLAAGEAEAALVSLRALIWREPQADLESLAQWRRLLPVAYLEAGRAADALTALLRYEQDDAPDDASWRRLRARVLLAVQRPQEARASLGADRDPRARPLYLMAALHSGAMAADEVRRAAEEAVASAAEPSLRAELWRAAAEAARLARDPEAELAHLARALSLSLPAGAAPGADGAHLWGRLAEHGRALGNRRQLLIGRDEEWLTAADELASERPWAAAALLSVPALEWGPGRAEAHHRLSALLAARERGLALLEALYLDVETVALDDLPAEQRLALSDRALGAGDFARASRLLGDLSVPPPGQDPWEWGLRRARILVLGGDHDGAAAALSRLLDAAPVLPRARADRLMQVLFDLQRVEQHRLALALFARLPLDPADRQLQREVLYWRADSHKALGEHVEAARLYLESAWLAGTDSMDPWAQTAQYQAADALAEAGLLADARGVYARLLAASKDAARQAVIRSRMQQLAFKAGKDPGEDRP